MSKFLRKTQFENVIKAIWDRAKDKFIEDITFDTTIDNSTNKPKNTLKKTKNGQSEDVVNHVVTEWLDLEYVGKYQFSNLLDLSKRIEGGHYNSTGSITNNATWSTVLMPIKSGTEYTMLRKDNRGEASRNIVFFNQDGGMVHYYLSTNAPSNGTYHYYTFTTTQDTAYLGISVPHNVSGSGLSCMIVEGHSYATYRGDQIPYADGGNIQIGSLVSHGFDNSNTNLSSVTLSGAIKELDSKTIKSVNDQLPNNLGNVTVNATHINTVGGSSVENELNELSMLKVDKYNNSFMVDLTVDDIKLSKTPITHFIPTGVYGVANGLTLAGNKDTSVQQDIKVSKILVGVDGYLEGETVTGVEVYAVNKANDTIVERIVYDGIGIARKPKGYENNDIIYVDVEVNKSFSVEVYFIARLRKNGNKGMRIHGTYQTGIAFDKTTNDQELQVGSGIPVGSSSTRVPSIIVYGNGESLSNAIVNVELNNTNRLDFKKANGGTESITLPNTVTSVNSVQPQQDGNVTVNAGHIGYDGNTSNILATNVQEAIDKLKEDVSLINGAEIFIVPNNTELGNLLNRNVVKHGDLIYVIDSTGVVDFDNKPANGGNPVAMIYDTSLPDTTNRLRVFSNLGTGTININASTVTYDDNVTALGATNVQKAVEQLNNKIVNAGTVKSVNSLTPHPDGDVELISQVNVGQNIVLRVGNQDFATLECMTDQEANAIIDGLTL